MVKAPLPVPAGLTVHSGGDEFTVTDARPRLSWRLPGAGVGAAEAELEVHIGDTARSTIVPGGDHLFLPWPFAPRRSGQEVQWGARLVGAHEPGGWSAWSAFEVGLLDQDWRAQWISPQESGDPGYGRRPAHRLSVRFDLLAAVTRARLYATALGVYEARVNRGRAGTTEHLPGTASYDETRHAQGIGVTGLVHQGENLLEIVLSDGWYRGQVGAFRVPAGWGSTLAARAELHLELFDGSTVHVRSDESWRSSSSTIVAADLMDGQSTDLTTDVGPEAPVLVDQVTAPPISW